MKTNDDDWFWLLIALFVGLPLALFCDAFVYRTLWAWFMEPNFGFGPLGWWQAYGVALLIGVATATPSAAAERKYNTYAERVFTHITWVIMQSGLMLGLGWCLK